MDQAPTKVSIPARGVTLAARLLLLGGCCLLLYAGLFKLVEPLEFSSAVTAQGLLKGDALRVATVALPLVEIGTGVMAAWFLATARTRRAGTAVGVIFGLFSAYAFLLVLSPPTKPSGCGCGFGGEVVNWTAVALRNAGLTAVSFFAGVCAGPTCESKSKLGDHESRAEEGPMTN
ncbi:MAG TPA: hypothetical protein PKE29_09300 [Phycisphaerales bacterium]|nr:hypothetical protein [Phycisphaerales bacterium]